MPETFARLDHRAPELNFPTAVLWARQDMLGGRGTVRRLGFLDLGAATGPVDLPETTMVIADIRSEHQVNLLCPPSPPLSGREPQVVAEAHFEDPHHVWWSDTAHREKRLVLLTSAQPMTDYRTTRGFLMSCWGAVLPLAIYAFDSGEGTRQTPTPRP